MGGCSFYEYNIAYSAVWFKWIVKRYTINKSLLYDIAFGYKLDTEARRCAAPPFFTGFLFSESGSSPPLAIMFKSAETLMDTAFPLSFCP